MHVFPAASGAAVGALLVVFGATGDAVLLGAADDALLGEADDLLVGAEDVLGAVEDDVDGAALEVVADVEEDEAATVLDRAAGDEEVLSLLPPQAVRARASEAAAKPPARCRVIIWGSPSSCRRGSWSSRPCPRCR